MRTTALYACVLIFATATAALGDNSVHEWAELPRIQTIAILPAVLCTGALGVHTDDAKAKIYQQNLRLILHQFDSSFFKRLHEDPSKKLISPGSAEIMLRRSHTTLQESYIKKSGKGTRDWPTPDLSKVVWLAKRLKVDGVLLCALREPASIGEGLQLDHQTWNLNPFNIGLRHIKPHVVSPRIQAVLINRRGIVVWRDDELANHPRTKPSTLRNLRADWLDATDEAASLLADSLQQHAPFK